MPAALRDLRIGLAANLSAIPGVQTSAYVRSSPTLPFLYVMPGRIEFDSTMARGIDTVFLTVVGLVTMGTDQGGQEMLDRFLAPDGEFSVKQAAEADPTLGGVAMDLHVTEASGYRAFAREAAGTIGGSSLGAEWSVMVLA